MKPVLPKGGQSILSRSWTRNKATEDSERHPRGLRREGRFFSSALFHNTLIHNDLPKIRSYRDVSGFTVFSQFSQQKHVLPGSLEHHTALSERLAKNQQSNLQNNWQKEADTKQINLFCSRLLRNLACGHLYCCASAKQINLFCSRLLRIFAPLLEFLI